MHARRCACVVATSNGCACAVAASSATASVIGLHGAQCASAASAASGAAAQAAALVVGGNLPAIAVASQSQSQSFSQAQQAETNQSMLCAASGAVGQQLALCGRGQEIEAYAAAANEAAAAAHQLGYDAARIKGYEQHAVSIADTNVRPTTLTDAALTVSAAVRQPRGGQG